MRAAFSTDRRRLLTAGGAAALAGLAGMTSVLSAGERWQRPGGLVPAGEWWSGGGPRDAPSGVDVVGAAEPGERLVLSGRVLDRDERPLRGITVYVYQTDALGHYYREGMRHAGPRLRAWANTDAGGRYQFATIRPAHYPGQTIPEHIHMTVSSGSMREWWLPEVRFEGDRFITDEEYRSSMRDGAYGNVRRLTRDERAILRCARDVRI